VSNRVIRVAMAYDLGAIAQIQQASPQASQWAPRDYLAYSCHVAEIDGKIAGFLVSRETARGEREILNLAVDPPFRRRGIAKSLLAHELQCYTGVEWFLEVRASNADALKLYESLLFKRVGSRNNYYREPPESAIVMRLFS